MISRQLFEHFNSPKEPPSSVPKCDVKPCIHVWGDATGMPGIMESVQLNMNGIPALQPCMQDAEIACLAEYTWSSKGIPLQMYQIATHWANVVEKFREVSDSVWVSFECCDYREDIKRGMNK